MGGPRVPIPKWKAARSLGLSTGNSIFDPTMSSHTRCTSLTAFKSANKYEKKQIGKADIDRENDNRGQ